MTYSDKLKDPRWQKKRLEVLDRDKFRCTLCGDDKTTLHIHHKKYSGEPWEASMDHLTSFCADCHSVVENIKSTIGVNVEILSVDKRGLGLLVYSMQWGKVGVMVYTRDSGREPFKYITWLHKGLILDAAKEIEKYKEHDEQATVSPVMAEGS